MVDLETQPPSEGRRKGRQASGTVQPVQARSLAYRQLRNPFQPQTVFSADQVASIHDTALRVLQDLGIKVLLPEARAILKAGGALVDEDSLMVRIGREMVEQALATCPTAFLGRAGDPSRDVTFAQGALNFVAGCGASNVSDTVRGRRPGSLADFSDLVRLTQHFDVLHLNGPFVEAQDIPPALRHYAMTRSQLTLSDKIPFLYARGTAQTQDGFEMIRLARNLERGRFPGRAPVLYNHQHQFAPAAGPADVAGNHRLCPRRPDQHHHTLLPCRCHCAHHGRGRPDTSARRGSGRDHAGATEPPKRAGGLWQLLVQRRHEVWRALVWHARAYEGHPWHRATLAADRHALAVGRGICVEPARCAGGARKRAGALGVRSGGGDGADPRGGLAGRGP